MAPLPFSVKEGHRCPRLPLLANSVARRFDSVLVGAHGNFSALELRYPFFDLLSSRVWSFVAFSGCLPVSQLTPINLD